jgi:hypothetical protein
MNMQGIQLQQPTNRKNRKRRGGASFFHSNKMNWSIGPLRAEFTSKQRLVPKHLNSQSPRMLSFDLAI